MENRVMKMALFFLLTLIVSGTSIKAQEYSAMTFNIRYSTPNDGENWWELRKEWVANVVNFYEPDVMGIQEGLHTQVQFLDSALVNYEYVGVGRDDAKEEGEYAAIFYRSNELEVLDNGTFWLSETPDIPSFGWGANFRRIATWAKFKLKKTEKEFWVFNAHLDHETPLARLNAVRLIVEKAEDWNQQKLPVIVMGDLNAPPESPPIKYLSSKMYDSKLESKAVSIGPLGTYNGFDVNHPLDNRIDYIFVDKSISVQKYAVISETRDQKTPSDHLPVFIKFLLK
ncbi:MAG: endonuclease/exonuclease/phosphatase family protein [Balneolaceae bacterium]